MFTSRPNWDLPPSGGPVSPFPITSLTESSTAYPGTLYIGLLTNGTLQIAGGSGDANETLPTGGSLWYTPATTNIGNSYWTKLTINSGTGPTSGTAGSWLALSSDVYWTWQEYSIGTLSANITVQVASDSLGSSIVSSYTGNLSVTTNSGVFWPGLIVQIGDVGSGTRTAGVQFNNDGTITAAGNNTANYGAQWYNPTGGTPGFLDWIKLDVVSGTTPSGASTGTWLSISAAPDWYWTQTSIGTTSAVVNITIAGAASGTPILGKMLSVPVSVQRTS